MPNSQTHRLTAAIAIGGALLFEEGRRGKRIQNPIVGASVAALATNLPDLFEPAIHPNHRQFFHSVAFAGFVGFGIHKVYLWKTKDSFEDSLRFLLLVVGSAYLIHLALDACTARSLPLIGKL